jgi:hypothetical protein
VAYVARDDLLFAVRAYPSLQGLRLVPLGVGLVAKNLYSMVWPGRSFVTETLVALMALAALAGFFLVGVYYHHRFGRVEPRRGPVWGCLGGTAGVGLYFACYALDCHQGRLSLSSLFMACLSLVCYLGSKGRRWHYLPLALMFTALTVLPLTGIVSPKEIASGPGSLGNLSLGLFLVVGGVLDHRLLCRVLAAPVAIEAQSD